MAHNSIWKSEDADKFAEASSPYAESADYDSVQNFGVKFSDVFRELLTTFQKDGIHPLDFPTAKVLDVGCSTGSKLDILEGLGFTPENLYGVDVNLRSIEILKIVHPSYNAKVISGFDYSDFGQEFDIVYHTSVGCQVSPENMQEFFDAIRKVKAKYYFFAEGQSKDDEHHSVVSTCMQPHDHEHEDEVVHTGHHHHHAHDFPAMVKKYLPEARELFKKELCYTKIVEERFKRAKLRGVVVAGFQLTG